MHQQWGEDQLRVLNAAVRGLAEGGKLLDVCDLQDVSEALEAAEQGNAGALALATDLLPQVLSRPARQQDTETSLRIATICCEVLRLDAASDPMTLEAETLEVALQRMVDGLRHLRGGTHFHLAADLLHRAAELDLFITVADIRNPALIKDLLQACFTAGGRSDLPEAHAAQVRHDCAAVATLTVRECEQSEAAEALVSQLCACAHADLSCPLLKCLHAVLRSTEERMREPLQAHVRKLATFASSLTSKPAREHIALQNLVHHIAIATPDTLRDILPTLLQAVDGGAAASATLAIDVLAVLLTAPSVRRDTALHRSIVGGLLGAAEGSDEALRQKITNTLPHLVAACAHGHGRGKCEAALRTRVLDGAASVRVAAVRAVGVVATEVPAADMGPWLNLLVLRLKDTSEDVRSMALKTFMPLFATFVVTGGAESPDAMAPTLLADATPHEQRAITLFTHMLHSVCIPSSHKLLCMLPETAVDAHVLPLPADHLAASRLLRLVLADKACSPLLQTLLAWQGALRACVMDLFSLRTELQQALPGERATLRTQGDTAISKLLATYARVLPKAHLTAASVRQLLEHKDNRLVAAAKELCCAKQVDSLYNPIAGGRKRGRAAAHAASQPGSASPGPSQPRSQGRGDLLQDVARGLRGRSKDVLALLGMLSVDFVSPQHVQAFLASLKDQSELPSDDEAASQRSDSTAETSAEAKLKRDAFCAVRATVKTLRKRAPLLLHGLANDLVHCVLHGTSAQRYVALELAAGARKAIAPLTLVGPEQAPVVAALRDCMLSAPPISAGHAVWATIALLPAVAVPAALGELSIALVQRLREPHAAHDATALGLVHAASRLLRLRPALLAEDAGHLVRFALADIADSGACSRAARAFGCFDTFKNTLKGHALCQQWLALPSAEHHRATLVTVLAKGLTAARASASGADRAHLDAALTDDFLPRALACATAVTEPEDSQCAGLDNDAVARLRAAESLVRAKAAVALLHVGERDDAALSADAYIALANTVQDQNPEVRAAFGATLRSCVSDAAALRSSADVSRLAKYLPLLALSEPDPTYGHAAAMAHAARACLDAWWARLDTIGAAAAGAESEEVGSKQAAPALSARPEYSVVYLMYIATQHIDFPDAESLQLLQSQPCDSDDEAQEVKMSLVAFSRMLRFHIEALVASAPEHERPAVLSNVDTLARICGRQMDALGGEAGCSERLPLVATLAVQVAEATAGSDAFAAARALPRPRSALLHAARVAAAAARCAHASDAARLYAAIQIPKRIFEARSAQRGPPRASVKLPAWFMPEALSVELTAILSSAETHAAEEPKRGRKGRSKSRAARAARAPPKRSADATAARAAQRDARQTSLWDTAAVRGDGAAIEDAASPCNRPGRQCAAPAAEATSLSPHRRGGLRARRAVCMAEASGSGSDDGGAAEQSIEAPRLKQRRQPEAASASGSVDGAAHGAVGGGAACGSEDSIGVENAGGSNEQQGDSDMTGPPASAQGKSPAEKRPLPADEATVAKRQRPSVDSQRASL